MPSARAVFLQLPLYWLRQCVVLKANYSGGWICSLGVMVVVGSVPLSHSRAVVNYRKRGSASYIVREVRLVRERERERYREREKER